MKKLMTFLTIISVFGILSSCQSLVYSPSINLPDRIEKDKTNLILAYETLPLTVEDEKGNNLNEGFIALIQHSFSNRFLLQGKYWADINSMNQSILFKHGISLNATIRLNDTNASYKLYLLPSIGTSLEENSLMMGVFGLSTALQTPKFSVLEPFVALGVLYGNTFYSQNYKQGNRLYFGRNDGIAIIPNAGTYINLYGRMKLYIELSAPMLYNLEFSDWATYLVPTVGFKFGF